MLPKIDKRLLNTLSNMSFKYKAFNTQICPLSRGKSTLVKKLENKDRLVCILKQQICSEGFFNMSTTNNVHDVDLKEQPLAKTNEIYDIKLRSVDSTSSEVPRGNDEYSRAIRDLNSLQTNTQTLALAKYKVPEEILPLFRRQLTFAGIEVSDLNKLNIIHVTGTKGKGSTCAFVERILRCAGYKTGFYNSPHLLKVNERIKIDGCSIDDVKFGYHFRQVYDKLSVLLPEANISMPTYFSFLTILAYHIFLEEKVECAIIEVGIGGQYDPTNVVEKPVVCGISTLDYDHTSILGDSIESIAWSKAGIAKRGCPLLTVTQVQESSLDVIRSRAKEIGSPLYICKPIPTQPNFKLGIESQVQYKNAALACQLALHYLSTRSKSLSIRSYSEILDTNLSELPKYFQEALESCSWPGRCQIIEYPRATFFMDGAHTKTSMQNCVEWFQSKSSDNLNQKIKRILMVNIIGDRNKYDILQPLAHYGKFDMVLFSTNRISSVIESVSSGMFQKIQSDTGDKSISNAKINANTWINLMESLMKSDSSNVKIIPNTSDSVKLISEIVQNNKGHKCHVLVTGSLHFVGAVLETLSKNEYLQNYT